MLICLTHGDLSSHVVGFNYFFCSHLISNSILKYAFNSLLYRDCKYFDGCVLTFGPKGDCCRFRECEDASTVYVPNKINMYTKDKHGPLLNWHGQRVRKHLPAGQSMVKSHLPLPSLGGVRVGWPARSTILTVLLEPPKIRLFFHNL